MGKFSVGKLHLPGALRVHMKPLGEALSGCGEVQLLRTMGIALSSSTEGLGIILVMVGPYSPL